MHQNVYVAASINEAVLLVPVLSFFSKTLFFESSRRSSGIIVSLSTLKLADKVVAKMPARGTFVPSTSFLSSKYSPRSVRPNLLVGSTLRYNAEPHQLLAEPPDGLRDCTVPL